MNCLRICTLLVAIVGTSAGATPGLDLQFGDNGLVVIDAHTGADGPGDNFGKDMVVSAAGELLLAASVQSAARGSTRNPVPVLARLTAEGQLDRSFGNGGLAGTDTFAGRPYALALHADGIILAGEMDDRFALWRFDGYGIPDAGFGDGGTGTKQLGGGAATLLAVLAPGDVVVAGPADNGHWSGFSVIRLDAAGAVDTSFGANGFVILDDERIEEMDGADSIASTSGGKLIFAGGAPQTMGVFRLASNGQLDESFGNSGLATITIGGNDEYIFAEHVLELPDGQIVVSGYVGNDPWFLWPGRGFVVRLNADGSLDTDFANAGIFETDPGEMTIISSAVAAGDGSLYLIGTRATDPNNGNWTGQVVMLGLEADGSPLAAVGEQGYFNLGVHEFAAFEDAYAIDIAEHGQGGFAVLSDAWGATDGRRLALVRVVLKGSPGIVGFTTSPRRSGEDPDIVEIDVVRWGGDLGNVAVEIAVQPDSEASEGQDFELLEHTTQWAAGESGTKTLRLRFLEAQQVPGSTASAMLSLHVTDGSAALDQDSLAIPVPVVAAVDPVVVDPVVVDPTVVGPTVDATAESGGGALSAWACAMLALLCAIKAIRVRRGRRR